MAAKPQYSSLRLTFVPSRTAPGGVQKAKPGSRETLLASTPSRRRSGRTYSGGNGVGPLKALNRHARDRRSLQGEAGSLASIIAALSTESATFAVWDDGPQTTAFGGFWGDDDLDDEPMAFAVSIIPRKGAKEKSIAAKPQTRLCAFSSFFAPCVDGALFASDFLETAIGARDQTCVRLLVERT